MTLRELRATVCQNPTTLKHHTLEDKNSAVDCPISRIKQASIFKGTLETAQLILSKHHGKKLIYEVAANNGKNRKL